MASSIYSILDDSSGGAVVGSCEGTLFQCITDVLAALLFSHQVTTILCY